MPRSGEATRALFDEWADTYDRDLRRAPGPLDGYAESLAAAAALLPLGAGARVLDIGVGTGAFGASLAARGARVWGLDPSVRMLARCRRAHPAFHLAAGAFAALPYAAARFAAVVSSFAWHEVAPAARPAVCAELARVTEPGGHVCLVDIIFASPEALAEARRLLAGSWDEQEEYALVGALDAQLRAAGFAGLRWAQTAPCHWAVVGRRTSAVAAP